ncbi:hypothetical protein Pse7367_3786 (plasmid) [Thalassoporum mexicanum PCC 7367]|uniref:hypothetical protein n=1 Tax=Thalassoporum mexicanum TaxID=3457544 RepID=UPI00029FB7A5|nr:hypothetical protein [Pseudanabaena sp. PCC 7367]AFY72010.1 hypothetical protein Pse7367_3786 [Pseudanabaena sp. PCC 7367]
MTFKRSNRDKNLPIWVNTIVPYEYKADLNELYNRWRHKGFSESETIFKVIQALLSLLFATVRMIVCDLSDFISRICFFLSPRFPKNLEFLEKSFLYDYHARSIKYVRISQVAGFLAYALFGILDIWCIPSAREQAWIIRYGLVCPIFLLAFVLSFFKFAKRWLHFTSCFLFVIAGVGISVMIALSAPEEIGYTTYYTGLILTEIFGFTLFRLRFIEASIAGFLIFLSYEIVALFVQEVLSSYESTIIFVNNNFFFVTAFIAGMIACNHLEHYARRDYLFRYLAENRNLKEFYLLGKHY